MPDRVWYRSLYWRIGLGFIACVAGLLIAQAVLFVWLTNPGAGPLPGRWPQRIAVLVASDISAALENDPALDLERYVHEQFGHVTRPIFVLMRDGRVIRTRRFEPPPPLLRAARARLERELSLANLQTAPERPQWPDAQAEGAERADDHGPEGFHGRSFFGRIVVHGQVVGVVAAPLDGPPWLAALRDHAPTLAIAGIVLLIAGTSGMAFFVFRPAQRRLQALERAAAAIGAGETSARAPEQGGDEVAGLAHAFNKMAADLEARVRELRESDRARRQLLADVSHELMTPLTAMRGYLETLAMPQAVRNPADRDRYLQIVMDETLRLESIIGDLLELARLEGGGVALQREAVPVEWLFARAADRHGAALREKGITLDTRVAPGAETVDGDGRRLEQALQNLVANAIRHTPRGGRISLSAEPASDAGARSSLDVASGADGRQLSNAGAGSTAEGRRSSLEVARDASASVSVSVGPTLDRDARSRRRVRLVVRDTGPGIAPEHLPLIFDRFYKTDASREYQSAGSGLGLSIVKAIVERHGGSIAASSPPGGGAVFEIVLDALHAEAASASASPDEAPVLPRAASDA